MFKSLLVLFMEKITIITLFHCIILIILMKIMNQMTYMMSNQCIYVRKQFKKLLF